MKIPTTLDRRTWKKWLICSVLALLIILQALPVVMATDQQDEQTEMPTVTQDVGSEPAQESAASGEQQSDDTIELFEQAQAELVQTESTAVADDWTTTKPYEGEVLHGGYVGFKNKASGKFLTIPNGSTTPGTNVCMQSQSAIANAQEFLLEYTYNADAYQAYFRIFSVNPDGTKANPVKSVSSSPYTANVWLHSLNALNPMERWQIEHVSDNYYCIYLAMNPEDVGTRYALTATLGEGGADDNTVMSAGNAIVDIYTGADSQLWQICADGKTTDINGIDMLSGNKNGMAYPGETVAYYYIPKAFNETITWYNYSTDTISLDANGKATAMRIGTGLLGVTVTGGVSSLIRSYSASCHVLLHDGYYYIKNYYSDFLMDLEGGSKEEGSPIQVWNTGGSVNSNNQIFKFVHVGEGCYNILPLINETRGLSWSTSLASVLNSDVTDDLGNLKDSGKWR